ncbi:DUF2203 domain-containing protein, partial [candidate division KSB1 bacterium]
KFFTVIEANELIPELKKVLNKLKKQKRKANFIEYEISLAKLSDRLKIEYEGGRELSKKKKELNEVIAEINTTIKKIHDLGCFLKDADVGVIDFLSEKDGRPIFLCWVEDEDEIAYYHEIDTGYKERKYLWFD